jgi:chorismate dehydratase
MERKMKVGRIPYLSCEPFYFEMERRGLPLYDVVPSAMAGAIAQGDVDAGLVPLADCARLADQCRYLSGFCLAFIRKAGSVLLHAKQPIEALTGARIGVPGEATTSVQLLQILLACKYQVQVEAYAALDDACDALLTAGNEGLRRRGGFPQYPYMYDLGEEWYQWTSLPFVFARWMVRQDLVRQEALVLEDTLYTGLQDWADGLFRPSVKRDDVLMRPRDILEYTQGIRYFIGVTEQRAIDRFQHYLDQLSLP